jgi:hypothetical protein
MVLFKLIAMQDVAPLPNTVPLLPRQVLIAKIIHIDTPTGAIISAAEDTQTTLTLPFDAVLATSTRAGVSNFVNKEQRNITSLKPQFVPCFVFDPAGVFITAALIHSTSNRSSLPRNSSADTLIVNKPSRSRCRYRQALPSKLGTLL